AVAQDEIVAAKYVENAPVTFTVKFVDWNEDVLKTETVRKGSGATAPADPTRDGYVFKGWDKAFDNVTGDMTVTAVYEEVAGPYVHCSEQSVDMGSSVTLSVNLVDCSFPIKRLSVIFTDNSNSFVAEKGKWSNDYDYLLKDFVNELLLGSAVLSEQIIVDGNVFNLTLRPSEAAVPGTYTISVALTVSYFDDQENEHEVECRPTEVNIVIK
ncbi:MAG: InlB B-repeat-containing protein, partial [Ruminococcus sp.]|nr:InlB B-repeat-containing protein [Ruminococcus sp.]